MHSSSKGKLLEKQVTAMLLLPILILTSASVQKTATTTTTTTTKCDSTTLESAWADFNECASKISMKEDNVCESVEQVVTGCTGESLVKCYGEKDIK